ncbi:MAG: DUF4956 domain-containing protein [Tannerellaceae bacterium]|jgi:hypothetical protein|nr:DUF4956 domain-containing protein [Tannerellaceae bacterium]
MNPQYELLGITNGDMLEFFGLILRFIFNEIVAAVLIYRMYYRKMQRTDYLMTFFMINITVFFLVILLNNLNLPVGFALGLFAIFGIIRYRTITIPIREMTYLFILIGISVLNALANKTIGYVELMFANLAIMVSCRLFESGLFKKHIAVKTVVYDNIKLINAGREDELKADLIARLGLPVSKVEVDSVDFIRDSAVLLVSYICEDNKCKNNSKKHEH